jgi:hypothetical protein
MILYSLYMGRKELEKRKRGHIPEKYENKLPSEYSPSQKRHTKLIIVYLFAVFVLGLYLLYTGELQIAKILTPIGLLGWLGLIKLGNKVK